MVLGTVLPDLQRRSGQVSVIRSRTLRTWGQSESGIDEMLTGRMKELDALGMPTIAFQASGIEGIKVRVTAKTADEATAFRILDDEERRLRAILGEIVFGIDGETMETVTLDLLRARGKTLAAVELVTGGILAARMTLADPEMATFRGSTIGLPAGATLEGVGEARARAAAELARRYHHSDVGIAAIAAGDGEQQPKGTVFMAFAVGGHSHAERVALPGDRERLREFAVIGLLDVVRRKLPDKLS
jgi:nicotinamide-nucleotide amidase